MMRAGCDLILPPSKMAFGVETQLLEMRRDQHPKLHAPKAVLMRGSRQDWNSLSMSVRRNAAKSCQFSPRPAN
jgi:hypothetical protein